ncbi:MAG: FAD:protein FMN transferase [Bacteroidales bacterium]|nr:FAD:protein FMN transferase [Bacteroidales bacterium]MDY0217170.1 FAD:protein FMN transferase [Bacteroidales bacterium]
MKKTLFALFIVLISGSCQQKEKQYLIKFEGEAQGTYYSITYYDSQNRNLQTEIDSLLDAFNFIASVYEENSILSKINRNEEVELNDDFIELFNMAQDISIATEGAFDVTIGPLINAWGFGPNRKDTLPISEIKNIKNIIGFKKVSIQNNRLIKENPEIILNYNAIAQGFSTDIICRFLESKEIYNYLVDVGGEIMAKGHKASNEEWTVGIEKPADDKFSDRTVFAKISITNRAIATSGNYRKYYERDGKKYSHTIDPHSGFPVVHNLLSATVVADNAGMADGYATAFMVMGMEKALDFLKNNPDKKIDAYFIYTDEIGTLRSFATENLAKSVVEIN